jgi:hypothetical protein
VIVTGDEKIAALAASGDPEAPGVGRGAWCGPPGVGAGSGGAVGSTAALERRNGGSTVGAGVGDGRGERAGRGVDVGAGFVAGLAVARGFAAVFGGDGVETTIASCPFGAGAAVTIEPGSRRRPAMLPPDGNETRSVPASSSHTRIVP